MQRLRRSVLAAVLAAAAVACGISVVGMDPAALVRDAGPDSEPEAVDAPTGGPDAGAPPCDAGDSFCDFCDPALVLCLELDGGLVDESMYHRSLDVLGTPTFIVSDGVGAISLDGSVGLSLPTDPRTESFDEETIDIRVRVRTLPPDGGRYGLVDRNGASSMFLYGDGRLTCRGQIAYAYSPDATAGHFQRLTCVVARNGTAALYVQGARVAEGDADAPVVRAGERTMIGRDDLDNDASVIADPLQGDIATVRLYHRALTEKEIAPR